MTEHVSGCNVRSHAPITCPRCGAKNVPVYETAFPLSEVGLHTGDRYLASHDCPKGGDRMLLQTHIGVSPPDEGGEQMTERENTGDFRSFVERLELLDAEKHEMAEQVRAEELRSFIRRLEDLDYEKKTAEERYRLMADVQDEVLAEAKSRGYNVHALLLNVEMYKVDSTVLDKNDSVLSIYKSARGMFPSWKLRS